VLDLGVRSRVSIASQLLVDGTHGSAMVGLRKCWLQHTASTPKPVWNPDVEQPIDFFAGWQEVPDQEVYP
jgi:hypothetical protein